MKRIFYIDGIKYQLTANYMTSTKARPDTTVKLPFIKLTKTGTLILYAGFAWDGPSGPVVDIQSFMRSSAKHDALYRLMRAGLLPQSCKEIVDEEMKAECIEDGMSYPLAEIAFQGVEHGGKSSCKLQSTRVLSAP